jgi:hypothetical protein
MLKRKRPRRSSVAISKKLMLDTRSSWRFAVLLQRLNRFARQFSSFAVDPPHQNVGVENDH